MYLALLKVPFFLNNQKLIVAASLNGGNSIDVFVQVSNFIYYFL